ncbi:hypothetical protein ES708_15924 [subsurface metagenome]
MLRGRATAAFLTCTLWGSNGCFGRMMRVSGREGRWRSSSMRWMESWMMAGAAMSSCGFSLYLDFLDCVWLVGLRCSGLEELTPWRSFLASDLSGDGLLTAPVFVTTSFIMRRSKPRVVRSSIGDSDAERCCPCRREEQRCVCLPDRA